MIMPTGVLVNCTTVLAGSLIGAALSARLPKRLAESLPNVFGYAALAMGISLIMKMENLSPVILALISGTAIGEYLELEDRLLGGLKKLEKKMPGAMSEEQMDHMITMLVLFCFSGTGIFGVITSAVSGDHSILYTKAIMDFFTAIIFASKVGYKMALIPIPQCLTGVLLFFASGPIYPLLTESMLNDFKACGGIITLAIGLKIAGIKKVKGLNMLPALVLALVFSWMWTAWF